MFTISCLKRLPNPPLIFQQKLDSKTLHSSCCFLRSGAESQLSRLTLRSHSTPTLLPSLPAPPRPRLPSTDLAPLSTSDSPSLRYPVSLQLRCAITDDNNTRQGIEEKGRNARGKVETSRSSSPTSCAYNSNSSIHPFIREISKGIPLNFPH